MTALALCSSYSSINLALPQLNVAFVLKRQMNNSVGHNKQKRIWFFVFVMESLVVALFPRIVDIATGKFNGYYDAWDIADVCISTMMFAFVMVVSQSQDAEVRQSSNGDVC